MNKLRNFARLVAGLVVMVLGAELWILLLLLIDVICRYLELPVELSRAATAISTALIFVSLLLKFRGILRMTVSSIATWLDAQFPELEESSSLLLVPAGQLNKLEQLQLRHVEQTLPGLEVRKRQLKVYNREFILIVLLALPVGVLAGFTPVKEAHFSAVSHRATRRSMLYLPRIKPVHPTVQELMIRIFPPVYTGLQATIQQLPALRLVEGSRVVWLVRTTRTARQIELIFNGKVPVSLVPDSKRMSWTVERAILGTGYYQLKLDDSLSDYYKITCIKDQPPRIHISVPGQYTLRKAGDDRTVPVTVGVNDDFGVSTSVLKATVARGSGEAIKFSQFTLALNPSFSGNPKALELHQLLDLHKMGIGPGDEVYFYVLATDNHGQAARSDMFYVNMADTSKASEVSGLVKGLNPVPEYFRSERQLIMDTEKLLHDRSHLSPGKFREQCNDLGVDQKLLRQRYSKFLGEESSDDAGEAATAADAAKEGVVALTDVTGAAGKKTVEGSQSAVMSMFTEKPDNADDADIFEPLIKTELSAALDQMWSAERMLRQAKLSEALPFENKALKLLKLVQEKTRAYVSKTSFTPAARPPFVKRLSGDLTKIVQPVLTQTTSAQADYFLVLRQAIPLLEKIRSGGIPNGADLSMLEQARGILDDQAGNDPGAYISSVGALHKLLVRLKAGMTLPELRRPMPVTGISIAESRALMPLSGLINTVESACLRILPRPVDLPEPAARIPGNDALSSSYFKNLPHDN